MGKAFASPRRLELLDLLAQAPRTVDELARASEQSTANASQHLQALHAAGIVTREREGTSVRYALAGDDVLASGSRCATSAGSSPRSSAPRGTTWATRSRRSAARSCVARLRKGDVVLVDVRPGRGVRGRPHRGRPLDPDRRARGPPRRAARRSRGRRLLPRPVLRVRSRGGPPPAGRRPAGPPARGGLARVAPGRVGGGGRAMSWTAETWPCRATA